MFDSLLFLLSLFKIYSSCMHKMQHLMCILCLNYSSIQLFPQVWSYHLQVQVLLSLRMAPCFPSDFITAMSSSFFIHGTPSETDLKVCSQKKLLLFWLEILIKLKSLKIGVFGFSPKLRFGNPWETPLPYFYPKPRPVWGTSSITSEGCWHLGIPG